MNFFFGKFTKKNWLLGINIEKKEEKEKKNRLVSFDKTKTYSFGIDV